MYRAREIYPLMPETRTEYIFVTKAAKERIKALPREQWTKYAHETLGFELTAYLNFAEIMNWDISQDINYAYAIVKYSPDEIVRRVLRLYRGERTLTGCLLDIAAEYKISRSCLWCAATYHQDRTARMYARLMRILSREERRRDYTDALIFEE